MLAFAGAESRLHVLFRTLTGMPDAKARIVSAGLRGGDLIKRIGDLMPLSNVLPEKRLRFERAVKQFNLIADMRNTLVHWGGMADTEETILSLSLLVSRMPEVEHFAGNPKGIAEFNLRDFESALSDLTAITSEFNDLAVDPPSAPTRDDLLQYAWQYRLVRPTNRHQ